MKWMLCICLLTLLMTEAKAADVLCNAGGCFERHDQRGYERHRRDYYGHEDYGRDDYGERHYRDDRYDRWQRRPTCAYVGGVRICQ